ncbi:Zn-dependent protease [Sporosarcina newyorkensis 2681]|uniref:Zn-dependent protease n=1 Tax=Sporosarcina newyorkensis 2681 TaxID=1027292 RepID=F9DQ17_9BACL|nr:DUF2268 domain-containing putative Zn-dependent protease [Sporosarcina newyorkensis]EGQ27210.1 Zn-dependent protease [Sporosarcina newyorkensis 2681]
MTILDTNQWLLESYERPIELCRKLAGYFKGATAGQIYDHLTYHGLYSYPTKPAKQVVSELQQLQAREIVQKEITLLRQEWQGPHIPTFILPAHSNKSGLAFKDKLFIFLPADCSEYEIKAIVTHEFHHVCRLSRFYQKESDYTLLDSIVMEGLAEHAVRERLGSQLVAGWTNWYTASQLEEFWEKLFVPNRQLPKSSLAHEHLLSGTAGNPSMCGYAVGYFLVGKYMKSSGLKTAGLLGVPAEHIAKKLP